MHDKQTPATDIIGLAAYLIHDGLLDPTLARDALQQAKQQKLPIVSYLVNNNIVSSTDILKSCAKTFALPIADAATYPYPYCMQQLQSYALSLELIKRYRVIPLAQHGDTLHIGITDPTDQAAMQAIRFHTDLKIRPILITEEQLNKFLEEYCNLYNHSNQLDIALLQSLSIEDNTAHTQDTPINHDEPIILFVNNLIKHALQQSASDIHIEPCSTACRIRYRQDGILYTITELPINLTLRLVTRLKVMAKLDISERRLPQDGRLKAHSYAIDIRISTCPTLFGEKVVLRLLDATKMPLSIDALGLNAQQKQLLYNKLSRPDGMILVTGPTGSGKTVTLYSALSYLNTAEKNISTVEDPIEIQLTGMNQVNVNTKIGLDFATILRAFLRQDPDIIMVGEIRDTETAAISIQAAQTGHLVLSSVHANNSVETLTRLRAMGIANYNLISALALIIAQQLVRKLCMHCKAPENIPAIMFTELGTVESAFAKTTSATTAIPANIYRAAGCRYCQQGYHGRIGIYELLPITENIAQCIADGADTLSILHTAERDGLVSLRTAGLEKVLQGITSLSEINRVVAQ